MTAGHLLPPAMSKEIRAIAPGWLICMAALLLLAVLDSGTSQALRFAIYFLTTISLGALSMGHEYSGATLTLLLSQPRRREHVFLLKLGVLAAMLLTLTALARITLFNASATLGLRPVAGVEVDRWTDMALVVPLLCGLFIAPLAFLIEGAPPAFDGRAIGGYLC